MERTSDVGMTSNPMRPPARVAPAAPEAPRRSIVAVLWQEAVDVSTYFFNEFVGGVTHHDVGSFVPRGVWVSAGLIFNVGVAAIWAILLMRGVKEMRQTRFLSLETGSSFEVCNPVRRQLADTYRLDDAGAWSTTSSFVFRSSMVTATYRSFKFDDGEYKVFMGLTSALLRTWNAELSALPVDRALAYAVATRAAVGGNSLYVALDVDPESVLSMPFLEARLHVGDDEGVEFAVAQSRGESLTIQAHVDEVGEVSWDLALAGVRTNERTRGLRRGPSRNVGVDSRGRLLVEFK